MEGNHQKEEFPHFSGDMFYKLLIFCHNSESSRGTLLSLRSYPLAVTLSGFAGLLRQDKGTRQKEKGYGSQEAFGFSYLVVTEECSFSLSERPF
jgi:hypothetical protein